MLREDNPDNPIGGVRQGEAEGPLCIFKGYAVALVARVYELLRATHLDFHAHCPLMDSLWKYAVW